MDLAGAVALVTGAGSGIGRATALQLACGGAAVTVNDIDEPSARETVGLIEHHGGRATSICADVADETEVRRMIATTRERFGRLASPVGSCCASVRSRGRSPSRPVERGSPRR